MRKDTYVWHADSCRAAIQTVVNALKEFEKKYPYRYGMKKAEVQMTYFKKVKLNVFDKIVELLEEKQAVKRVDEFMCTPEYEVKKDATYDKVRKILLDTFTKAKYDFARYSEIDMKGVAKDVADDILNILLEEKEIVKVTDDMYTLMSNMESAKAIIQDKLKENPLITIAQVRDIFETSRKSAKPILEYMDSIKVTKKAGAESERIAY
jgi:selenocysteine-specific elongation factor